jgi:hypothetical protein
MIPLFPFSRIHVHSILEESMNRKLSSLFGGVILVAGGIYALANTMGYGREEQDPTLWTFIFGGIGVTAFIFYLIDGVRQWGWLFPAGIFGGLACVTGFVASGADNPAMAAPLFVGIGLPFVVAFMVDRKRNWWALIPAGVMAFLTLVLLAVDNVPGEWIGAGFLFLMAATFLLVYLSRRARWALLVAYIVGVLGFMPLLALTPRPELSGVVFLFAVGLPFLYIYLRAPERWWAIIPAGILLTLGLVTAVVLLPGLPSDDYDNRYANAILLIGVAPLV